MGQIVSAAAKPKRCNANQLSQVPTPAAGEYILVSSDNSMNAAGQGYFDCYIEGDGTKAATALTLHKFKAEELEEELYGVPSTSETLVVPLVADTAINRVIPCDMKAGRTYTWELTNAGDMQVTPRTVIYVYFKAADGSTAVFAHVNGETTTKDRFTMTNISYVTATIQPVNDIKNIMFYVQKANSYDTIDLSVSISWKSNISGILPTLATKDEVSIVKTFTDFGEANNRWLSPSDGTERMDVSASAQRLTIKNKGYFRIVASLGSVDGNSAAIVFSSGSSPSDGFISAVPLINGIKTFDLEVPAGTNYIYISNRAANNQNPSATLYQYVKDAVADDTKGVASSFNLSPSLVYVAHRGAHVNQLAPDNSVDAIYLAARAGFDYTEMDLRKTRDGYFVCMHSYLYGNVRNASDYSTTGITSHQNVELYTLQELRSNYVLQSPNEEMRKPVPTFEEMLWACKKAGVKPYVHCKIVAKGTYSEDTDPDNSLAYIDAERDVPMIWELIKTILGSDDIYWGGTYSLDIRPLSANVNVCCQMSATFPEVPSLAWAQAVFTSYGPKVHTNNNPYGTDSSYFGFENSKNLKIAGIEVGIYETEVAPKFNWLLDGGVDVVVSDYIAPAPNGKPSVFSANSDNGDYSDFVTDGVVDSDGVTLSAGQYITLKSEPQNLYFGGFYVAIEMTGSATLSMRGCSQNYTDDSSLAITGSDENSIFVYQYLTHSIIPSFRLTATGACKIIGIKVHQVEF